MSHQFICGSKTRNNESQIHPGFACKGVCKQIIDCLKSHIFGIYQGGFACTTVDFHSPNQISCPYIPPRWFRPRGARPRRCVRPLHFMRSACPENHGRKEEARQVFLQGTRLLELFDDKTFDSWQVRYSSPVSIMVEIVDALSSLVDAPVTHHCIKSINVAA